MKYKLIASEKAHISVRAACRFLHVSESGYYAWASRGSSERQRQDRVLLAHIREIFALSNHSYGSPRMTVELKEAGLSVGRRRVARLMRENGLKAWVKRRFKSTTESTHDFMVAPNLLKQDFTATEPNQKWAGAREADVYVTSVISGQRKAGFIWL